MRNLFVVSAVLLGQAVAVLLSKPSGKHHVGTSQHVLLHTTEDDVLAPNGTGDRFLVTFYYPTLQAPEDGEVLPYFDPIRAGLWEGFYKYPAGSLQTLETVLQWQAPVLEGAAADITRPTLIFSPGGGVEASNYAGLLGDLASYGWNVVAVDHPGEAAYLPLPYGAEGVYGLPLDYDFSDRTILDGIARLRISDALALVDLLPPLIEELGAPFNATHFALFGHSIGGATAAIAAARSAAFLGGIDLDGSVFYENEVDVQKPVLLLTSVGHTYEQDPDLGAFAARQTGWYEHFTINGSEHLALSDIPLWVDALDLRNLTGRIGNITGQRVTEVQSVYSRAFFEFSRSGKRDPLLESPSCDYPEMIHETQ